jgi:uncharacterized protein (TIGR03083 family)
MNLESHLAAIRDDSKRIAACAEFGDLTAQVAACPGWDLRALVTHVGGVHRWAAMAIGNGRQPAIVSTDMPDAAASGTELAVWMRAGAAALTDILALTPLDADSWHPFPLEQKAWVWSRRQAHETMMHRWDAEVTAYGSSGFEAEIAADGLQEFFELALPRVFVRERVAPPLQSLHVHCTDDELPAGAGDWIVWTEHGEYQLEAVHRKGDAALRGTAQDLLLVLMGRADRAVLDVAGDPAAAVAWLDLPGF